MVRRIGWALALTWIWGCSDDGVPTNSESSSSESSSGGPTTTLTTETTETSSSTTVDPSSSSSDSSSSTSVDSSSSSESSSSDSSSSSSDSSGTSSESSGSASTAPTTGEESSSGVTTFEETGSSGITTFEESGSSGVTSLEESGSGSGTFIIEPDAAPDECNTFDQDCPVGQKCNAFADGGSSWNALGCFDIDPAPADVGDACVVVDSGVSGIDNCVQGAICWNVDPETNTGQCIAYCEGTPDDPSCANGSPCITANEGVLNICLPTCDPLLQDCAGNEVCVPIDDVFVCAPDASGGLGDPGVPCEFLNVCNPGLHCAPADLVPGCLGPGCCTPFCDLTDPTADAGCDGVLDGTECVDFFEEGLAPPGHEDVGNCAIP